MDHMNKDHRLAIEDYLAVYGNVIIDEKISNIKLKAIELDHMEISFNHKDIEFEIVKPVAIEPPMDSIQDLRSKLVEMAKYSANKRGYSHVQIQDITYPTKPLEFLLLLAVLLCATACFYPNLVFDSFLNYILPSSLSSFLQKYTISIAVGLLVIHIIELKFVFLPKLNFYRVPIDLKLEWGFYCLLDGLSTIKRFERLVVEQTH